MVATVSAGSTSSPEHARSRQRHAELRQIIETAAHYLPAQGPITVFIHHNTLHAFEHLPFDAGVQAGARLFGCQPYLSEERYREHLQQGRILDSDLDAVLTAQLGPRAEERILDALPGPDTTYFTLHRAMLAHVLPTAPDAELRWYVAETDALSRFRPDAPASSRLRILGQTQQWVKQVRLHAQSRSSEPRLSRKAHDAALSLLEQYGAAASERWNDAHWESFALHWLWRICRGGAQGVLPAAERRATSGRHRDWLLEATGRDSDLLVHEVLIRLTAAFLDQGFSHWPLPGREAGLFAAFRALYEQAGGLPDLWLRPLAAELKRLEAAKLSPLESIEESLDLLGVPEHEWNSFLTESLLALRGWAGMVRQVELRADSVALPIAAQSLLEFLAVRLILDRLALGWLGQEALAYAGPLRGLRQVAEGEVQRANAAGASQRAFGSLQRAFQVFQVAQILGWTPQQLGSLAPRGWARIIAALEELPSLERRQLLHAAFERRYRIQTLDALSTHAEVLRTTTGRPRFQLACCLDEREESFRRHLEELCPEIETFGVAGFYNIAMYYRGVADAHYVPLCPIVVKPKHWILEQAQAHDDDDLIRQAKTRRALGVAWHRFDVGSRGFAAGALLAAGVGSLASVPLVAGVLFPRLTARLREWAGKLVHAQPATTLTLERVARAPGPQGDHVGFSAAEMAEIGERLLRDMGLTDNFARLVAILGHGSRSLNNPHVSAYNCGACGGNAGGANGRVAARILNDPRVRQSLRAGGIVIPDDTIFIGGLHNTCNDSVTFYDADQLPESHRQDYELLVDLVDDAGDRNAQERCRRFRFAPLDISAPSARRHVEGRAEDLAQTRPELGHATNALCIVGRRSRTRGLFMDRRAFLTSYDPQRDDAEHTILTRLLQAAVPVCAGINLEYFFSFIDNAGYGCGSKLPHNVTSLLGVMDGAASDLRTGLPWQMVEFHEPVRLLMIVETTPEALTQIMDRHEGIGRPIRNGWVQAATLDPNSSQIHVLRGDRFEPHQPQSPGLPIVAASIDWYRGRRDFLGYAQIDAAAGVGRTH